MGIETPAVSSAEIPSVPPPPPTPTKTQRKPKFNETPETSSLSNSELQRLVLLEQLELIRVQKQKDTLILNKLQNGETFELGGCSRGSSAEEGGLTYTIL